MSHPIDHKIVLRDPGSVLQTQLGEDLQVLDFETTSLVKVGDNYGSTILKVCATIKRKNDGKEEELHLVAKMLPASNFTRRIFDSEFTFKKEIFIYEDLIPTYQSLYDGVFEVAPRFYGSRLSCDTSADEVDEDAVILMENLKSKGYYMKNRFKGLDTSHLQVAISALAKFHAIGLSIKHKKPSYLPKLEKYAKPMAVDVEAMQPFLDSTINSFKDDIELSRYLDRIKATGNANDVAGTMHLVLKATDPWTCVVHNDFWINNALFHRDESGIVDDAKIVDFQTFYMSSPLTDLVFFLCTSMEVEAIMSLERLDEMLELYRQKASEVLRSIGCDLELFSRDRFDERLRIDARSELFHIILMAKVVELREDEDIEKSPLNEYCVRRLRSIINVFVSKRWI